MSGFREYAAAFERDEREARARDIQAMMDDPGDEPSSEDLPDYVDTRREVSPWDYDPLFDIDDANIPAAGFGMEEF